MAAERFYLPAPTVANSNGFSVAGARANFYLSGGLTRANTYTTSSLSTTHPNPVPADGAGRFPVIFLDDSIEYRLIITDPEGVVIVDDDPYIAPITHAELQESVEAVESALEDTQDLYDILIGGYVAPAPKMDMYILWGQSLTVARGSIVTSAAAVVPTLYTFNGGAEYAFFDDPASGSITSWPAHPDNFETLENFVPYTSGNKESMAAGIGYQSAQVGTAERSFFYSAGYGGTSARQLREGNNYWCGFAYGLQRAVGLIRAAGYEPNPIIIWSQGHANADQKTDGNLGGETETSSADYQIACNRIFASIRRNVSFALGTPWTGPIWVEPLLTGGTTASAYTLLGRRNIVAAQLALQSSGVRLLPAWSQWVANAESDGVHPNGQGFRYRAELYGKFTHTTMRPPKMVSKAVVGSTVEVTFDQPVKVSSLIPDGSSLAGLKGFEIYEDDGTTAKTISTVAAHGTNNRIIVLTPTTTTNLTSTWLVRNGLHQTTTGTALNMFPRTQIVGTTDVGTTEDGIVMENASIPQEI